MAESSAQARNGARFTAAVSRGLRESAVIVLGIVALVLLMALATYSPDDPGFSFTGSAAIVRGLLARRKSRVDAAWVVASWVRAERIVAIRIWNGSSACSSEIFSTAGGSRPAMA